MEKESRGESYPNVTDVMCGESGEWLLWKVKIAKDVKKEDKICMICAENLVEYETVVQLYRECENFFYFSCILEVVAEKGCCPQCRNNLKCKGIPYLIELEVD